jgi:iron complex outermembrane receptor protein
MRRVPGELRGPTNKAARHEPRADAHHGVTTMFIRSTVCRLWVRPAAGAASLMLTWAAFADVKDGSQLDEVVVTAQKRSENIEKVPMSLSALDDATLDNLHATQLADMAGYIPGLQLNSVGSPGQASIAIRGIAPLGFAGGSPVATYIDDAPIGGSNGYAGSNNFTLDLLPYDVERLEVLRGPQGTLYGANALGGLLKYVLKSPDLSSFSVRAGADLFGVDGAGKAGGGGRVLVNAPLIADRLGMSASYGYENSPGYINNTQIGREDVNGARQQSARLALLWQVSDKINVHANALYQGIRSDGNATEALSSATLQPLGGDLTDNEYTGQPFKRDFFFYSATLEADLDWASFTSASSYSRSKSQQTIDQSRTYGTLFPFYGAPAGITDYIWTLDTKKYTQEFRLTSPATRSLEWLVGSFITYEDTYNLQVNTATDFAGVPLSFNPAGFQLLPTIYREYAVFGNATYHFGEWFDIAAGARFARNDQTFHNFSTGPLFGEADLPGQSAENVWTYSVSPQLHITPDSMAYARVATGYQPGGPNFASPAIAGPYKSDTLTNYELGIKSELLERRLTLNVDVFEVKWKDIQLLAFTNGGFAYYSNGGTARSRGIEGDVSAHPTTGLTLSANFAYTDAVLTEDVASVQGLSGDRLPNVARVSGAVQADYLQPLSGQWRMQVGGGLRYQGARYSAVTSSPQSFRLPPYAALDLYTALSNSNFTARIFAKNVANRRGYTVFQPVQDASTGDFPQVLGTILQPRTVGLAVDVTF